MTTLYARKNLCHRGSIIRQGAHLPADVTAEQLARWQEEDAVAPVPVVAVADLSPVHLESRAVGPAPPPDELFEIQAGAVAGEVVIADLPPGFSFPAEPAVVAVGPAGGPTLDEHGQPVDIGPADLAALVDPAAETTPAAEITPAGLGPSPVDGPAGGPPAGALTEETTPSGVAGQPASPTPPAVETGKHRGNRNRR